MITSTTKIMYYDGMWIYLIVYYLYENMGVNWMSLIDKQNMIKLDYFYPYK